MGAGPGRRSASGYFTKGTVTFLVLLTCLPYANPGDHVFNFCGTLPDKNEDCAKAVMVRASVIVQKTSCHRVKSPFFPSSLSFSGAYLQKKARRKEAIETKRICEAGYFSSQGSAERAEEGSFGNALGFAHSMLGIHIVTWVLHHRCQPLHNDTASLPNVDACQRSTSKSERDDFAGLPFTCLCVCMCFFFSRQC